MVTKSMRHGELPAALLEEISTVLLRHGYEVSSPAEFAAALAAVVRLQKVEPESPTPQEDVNPVCGHPLGQKCHMCGVCLDCQGCYCDELSAGPDTPTLAEIADRRAERWQLVADAVAAGAPLPNEVRIAEDGWSVHVRVADEAAVNAFGAAAGLDVGQLATRVYSPKRGTVVRETSLERVHPCGLRVWCEDPVHGLPAPTQRRQAERVLAGDPA